MSIKGVIFDYQQPTAKNFGALFSALADCKLHGCAVAGSGNKITIGSGVMCIGGRAFEISGTQEITAIGTGYVRLICNVDLSGAASTTEFAQVYFTVETKSGIGDFTQLLQENVNWNGAKYQSEIAVFTIANDVIGEVVREIGGISPRTLVLGAGVHYGDTEPTNPVKGQLFFKTV